MYAKDLNEPNYQFLIKKGEEVGIKHLNDPKAFIEYSNTMDDVQNNINDYNPNEKRKNLIVFDGSSIYIEEARTKIFILIVFLLVCY